EIDRDLEAVCLRCIEKKRGSRYVTAIEVASELARVEQGEPTLVRPASLPARTWRRIKRNRQLASMLVGATLLIAVVLLAAAILNRPGEDEATKARRELAKALRGPASAAAITAIVMATLRSMAAISAAARAMNQAP